MVYWRHWLGNISLKSVVSLDDTHSVDVALAFVQHV